MKHELSIQEKRLAVLEDTCNHFNSTNRCVNYSKGLCQYSPTSTSEGCAVGRLIADKGLCKKLDNSGGGSVNSDSVKSDSVFNRLPNDLQELGKDFLIDLQDLHDTEHYWDKNGLTEQGEAKFDKIFESCMK